MSTKQNPTQEQLDAFLVRAKFTYGWDNLESSARRMVEHACGELLALEAEVERLTTLAHGQHIELYNARLQLAAAQGQAVAWIEWDTNLNEGDPDSIAAGCDKPDLACDGWEWRPLYLAAPIPQQPSVPEGWKLVPIELTHEQLVAMSNSQAVDDESVFPTLLDLIDYSGENKTRAVMRAAYAAVLAAAPQPKETK